MKKFYECLLIIGGPKICTFVAQNLNGPEKDSVYRWRKKNTLCFVSGIDPKNFENAKTIISGFMQKKNIPQIPWLCAEDETGVQKSVTFHQDTDLLIGFCGKKGENHECLVNIRIAVGDDMNSYDKMVEAFQENIVGSLARVLILNPLHSCLPTLVVSLFPTCNRFTHTDVDKQWNKVEELFRNIMENSVGPLIGHSSDGDSRRRVLMLSKMLSTAGIRYNPVGKDNGFFLTAKQEPLSDGGYVIRDLGDQDWIHNGKKYINHLDHVSRNLMMGNGLVVLMNHVERLIANDNVHNHGLTKEHVRRDRDRQNWKIAQELSFKRVQERMEHLMSGNIEGCPPDTTMTGTVIFLKVMWFYIEIFGSPILPLKNRITYAGVVVHFLSVWRNYVFWEDGMTLKSNFISNQCYLDIIMSCHSAVMLICFFRDNYSHLSCPLSRMGSDCCELFFSKNTQFIGNHPVYPFGNMLRNVGFMNRLAEIEADENAPIFNRAHEKQKTVWEKQYKKEELPSSDILREYPERDEEQQLWCTGRSIAKTLLIEAGIKRNHYDGYTYDGDEGFYDWFDHPEKSGDHPSLYAKISKKEISPLDNDDDETFDETHHQTVDDTNDIDFQLNAEPDELQDTQHTLSRCIDEFEVDEESEQVEQEQKISATVMVPGYGRQYKSSLVKLLNEDSTRLSKDRLTRVRFRDTETRCPQQDVLDTCKYLVLFHEYALLIEDSFKVIRVHRMMYIGGKKRVEYKNPVSLEDSPTLKNLEIICTFYREISKGEYVQDGKSETVKADDILCHVNLIYDDSKKIYVLPSAEHDVIRENLSTESAPGTPTKKQKLPARASAQNSFDGTFVEVVQPTESSSSNGCRKSTRKRTIRHFLSA